jgi:hypothetical protein
MSRAEDPRSQPGRVERAEAGTKSGGCAAAFDPTSMVKSAHIRESPAGGVVELDEDRSQRSSSGHSQQRSAEWSGSASMPATSVDAAEHYNHERPHRGRELQAPDPPPRPATGPIERRDRPGGLLHEYQRAAA